MATTEEKDKTQQAIEDADAKKKAAHDAANATELAKFKETQQAESNALSQYNAAQYSNVGQILADVQSEIDKANIKDEKAIKRENAFRYIAGLGDTLSGLANLVGVAHGAANQPQTYHGSKIVEKAEQARKERRLEIDALNKRLDEMKAREREMKAAGSLQEVQLNIQHQKEQRALEADQRARELAAEKTAYEQQIDARDYALKAAEAQIKAGTAAAEAQYKQGLLGVRQQEADIKRQKANEQAKKQKEYTRKAVFGNMVSFVGEDGKPFSIGEKTLRRNTEFALPTMKEDIAKQAGFNSFAEYESWRGLSEKKQRKYFEEKGITPNETLMTALKRLRGAQSDEVEDIVKQYGRYSPAFMKQLRTAAQKDEEEFRSVWGDDEEEDEEEEEDPNAKLTKELGFTIVK